MISGEVKRGECSPTAVLLRLGASASMCKRKQNPYTISVVDVHLDAPVSNKCEKEAHGHGLFLLTTTQVRCITGWVPCGRWESVRHMACPIGQEEASQRHAWNLAVHDLNVAARRFHGVPCFPSSPPMSAMTPEVTSPSPRFRELSESCFLPS